MFNKLTVFILGAGASWHYGYPTGENLVRDVIAKAEKIIGIMDETKYRGLQYREIFEQISYSQKKIKNGVESKILYDEFYKECAELARRLRQVNPPVIDYFLGQNEDIQDIAKMLIAWVILECEARYGNRALKGGNNNYNRKRMLEDSPDLEKRKQANGPNYIDLTKYNDDWYRFLLYKLTMGCKEPKDLLKNKVRFITFNYDVSLENSLAHGLRAIDFFQKNNSPIHDFLTEDRFLHVYGKIRPQCFEDLSSADFKEPHSVLQRPAWLVPILNNSYEAAAGIRTIDPHEKFKDEETLSAAKKLIQDAQEIYILGYGFDRNNSERLNLHRLLGAADDRSRTICFTNFEDRQAINKRASEIFFNVPYKFSPADPLVLSKNNTFYVKSTRSTYEALEQDFDFL